MAGNKINLIKFSPVDIEARKKIDFKAGDTVNVWSKILEEKGKFRLQAFEGIVLGVGVERIFPLYSPMIDKIEITKKSRARRSKLYYIRTKAVKDVRGKMRAVTNQIGAEEEVVEKAPE